MNRKKLYGLRVAAGCFFVMFACQAALQAFSVFMPSILGSIQATTAQVSLMTTVACVVGFTFNMLVKKIISRIGCRNTLIIGCICCAGHFIIYGTSNSLAQLYLGSAFAGVAIGLATYAPLSIVISSWFIRGYGTVWSIVVSGSMIAGVIMYPIAGTLIERVGWRSAYLILSVGVAVISLSAALFLIIDTPGQIGLAPIGQGEVPGEDTLSHPAPVKGPPPRRDKRFYVLLLGLFLVGVSTNCENFLPAYWQSIGLSVSRASICMSLYAGLCAVASIVLGRITDRINSRVFQTITSISFFTGTLLFALLQPTALPLILLSSLFFAFGGKKVSGMIPPIVMHHTFGREAYPQIAGFSAGVVQLGIAVSSPTIGYLKDVSGTYTLPFVIMAGVGLLAFLLLQAGMGAFPAVPTQQQ